MPIKIHPDDRNGDYTIRLLKPIELQKTTITVTSAEGEESTLLTDSELHHSIPIHGQMLSQFEVFRRFGNLPDNNILVNKLINSLGRNSLALYKQMEKISTDEGISEGRRKEQLFYLRLESESNFFHTSVFEALATLELGRSHDGNNTYVIDKESEKVTKLYDDRIAYFEKQLDDEDINPIYRSRIQQQINIMKSNKDSTLQLLNEKGTNLQTLYRKVMDDFAEEQRKISIYQHRGDRPLDYANRSLTEAYQNASYAMEKHVFSTDAVKEEQLWIVDDTKKDINIDTRHYPSMRKEDALYTACIIESIEEGSGSGKELFEERKKAIQKECKVNREKDHALATRKTDEQTIKAREVAKATKPDPKQIQALMKSLQKPKAEEDNAMTLWRENPVHLFHSKDIFSAIGFACVDFGKYFEGEMAAKKPVMTAAMFVAMAATFGSAGLAAAGMHSMQGLSVAMSKILSFGGKLGVSPEQMHSAIEAISDAWLELTYSKGSLMHILIMNGFGLPKINYTIVDTILNHSENKDTLQLFAERISSQDLTGYTDKEKTERILHNVFMVAAMLGGAIALGLTADMMVHAGGLLAHLGAGVETLIDVPFEAFSSLAAHSVTAEVLAIVALALTVKSAGLFLGKVFLVLNHMKEEVPQEQRAAAIFMGNIKEGIESGEFDAAKLESLKNDPTFIYYRTHFEDLMEHEPKLEEVFDSVFLNQIGVTKPELPLSKKVGTWLGSAATTIFKEYLWEKMLLPITKIATCPLVLTGLGWAWGKNSRVGRDAVEGASILTGFVTNVGIMLTAAVKTLSISLYGTAQRVLMAASDVLFDVAAVANYIIRSPEKVLYGLGFGITKVLVASAAIVTNIAKYPLTIATGVTGAIIGGIISAGAWLKDKVMGTNSFDTAWSKTKEFMRIPMESATVIQNVLANVSHGVDAALNSAKGADSIVKARDVCTGGIARGFDWLKTQVGKIAYAVRNVVVRSQERFAQEFHAEQQHLDRVAAQAADVTVEHSITGHKALNSMGGRVGAVIDDPELDKARALSKSDDTQHSLALADADKAEHSKASTLSSSAPVEHDEHHENANGVQVATGR